VTSMPRLVVSDLTIAMDRSNVDVVDQVSFTVDAGEVLGLVGESGSGKTTVGLAMLGYARRGLRFLAGSVALDGQDIMQLRQGEVRKLRGARIAYVPQDPTSALDPSMHVGKQVAEVLKIHSGRADRTQIRQRMEEVLREVALDPTQELLRSYPHQLSGGQQQRIGLAMAFACRPSLIVLDEPTTGLDVTTQRHVLETVRSLCGQYGVAAVYVSHDLAVVGDLVDKVAVMYAGRIVEYGRTSIVFGQPAHPYTRGLLAAVPTLDRAAVLSGIEGQPPRPGNRPNGCAFSNRCSRADEECVTSDPTVREVNQRQLRCFHPIESGTLSRSVLTPNRLDDMSGTPHLEVRDLNASYGPKPVLHEVAFSVSRGSCLALVGESGSGKTTLARCVVGLHRRWEGDIQLDGQALPAGYRSRSDVLRRQVQFIFQNPYTALNPRRTIGATIAYPLQRFGGLTRAEQSERVESVLRDVALPTSYLSKYPDQLSGGERQRVAIARGLVVEPEVLVCDEITSALDASVQAVIVEMLRRLQADRGLTLVFVTHNLALVRSIAQDVVVMAHGRVVESGAVYKVLDDPQMPYTKQLLADVPRLKGQRWDADSADVHQTTAGAERP